MLSFFRRLSAEWRSLSELGRLGAAERELVVYAEGPGDWPHLEPVLRELAASHGQRMVYLTSDDHDPVLRGERLTPELQALLRPLYIGSGTARTLAFRGLDCRVCLLTLPDLEKYQLKRSVKPVRYVYLFHSINSSHRVYREGAFDHYDTILCVGPHHTAEIRKTEQAYGLKPKQLVDHGYGRLDALLERQRATREQYRPTETKTKRVVLAPSWGTGSIIEGSWGEPLIRALLEAGHTVDLRLHPMTVRHHPTLAGKLAASYGAGGRFRVITDMSEQDSLAHADVMISDWSGASFDFAFGLERPVLFVNTPPKVNNAHWERVGLTPLEHSIRKEIGDVLEPSDLHLAGEKIGQLTRDHARFVEALRAARERWIYHVGRSGRAGADEVVRQIEESRSPRSQSQRGAAAGATA
ncbi:MAG: CDP-glycerol glycerophosphotransferase family protein [Bdellovibrionales bacterium]|nr:CDP-glycerol glycerophosphotransferase family protein [Bdellovibrionales bacterium]